jgi:hypothetical protein
LAAYPLNKIILFEYDKTLDRTELLNEEAGIWTWKFVNTVTTVDDDNGNTGYYEYQNSIEYIIKSLKVDGVFYSKTTSLADCRATDSSFYYDLVNFNLYIHFADFEPPLNQNISYGGAVGYSKLPNNIRQPYFNDFYYDPRLLEVSGLSKSVDPLFFGLLQYSSGSVTLFNNDGNFDDWRSRNLYGQPARILVGDIEDDYNDFESVYEGFIADDSRTFEEFTITLEDPRRALTQPVATNLLTTTDYPDLKDEFQNTVKPVAYGSIKNAPAKCLNSEETPTPTYYTFLICDTEFNLVSSLDNIYVDGILTAITGTADLLAGTFTMTAGSVSGNLDNVTIDFTANSISNGANIIKDLLDNYDLKPFVPSFWDITEVDEAELLCRDTSLYIDNGSTSLSEAIESVLIDIDGRFFVKNNGLYTLRIYSESRTPNEKEIENDEWMESPEIFNNGSEYLSSAIVTYLKDISSGSFLTYEDTTFQSEAFERYKRYKTATFETNLVTLAAAQEKAQTIMNISKEVQDVVVRRTSWDNFGIEPSDFVVASPASRLNNNSSRGIYEVLTVENNLIDFDLSLSLRYVKDADPEITYDSIDDNIDLNILDNNNNALIGRLT